MKTKRYFKTVLLTMAVSGLCLQSLAKAQDTSQPQPAYSSAVKAGQAAHVAKQEAMTTNSSLQTALTDLEKAENQMDQLQMSDDQHQKMSAETTLNNAEDKYVGMLSEMSGVSVKDISDMHTTGVDWADVPSELGIHGMIGHNINSPNGHMAPGAGGSGNGMDSGETGDHDNGMSGSMGGGMGGSSGAGGDSGSGGGHGSGGGGGMH